MNIDPLRIDKVADYKVDSLLPAYLCKLCRIVGILLLFFLEDIVDLRRKVGDPYTMGCE